ncbi:MAG TPA: DMT family transporter [Hyphomicrobiaceae bacterium]|nr:DMT family transporter [Hyphomicrobiaceae bacterium]
MSRLQADLLLILCAAVWGFAFLFQKTAMEHVGPMLFVALRSAVACIALAPIAILERRWAPSQGPSFGGVARAGLLAGLAFATGAILQQAGLITASVTNTGFLTALYVVITPFIAWVLIKKKPALLIWIAVALSFIGIWLLGGGTFAAFGHGDLLVAVSAVFWALHVVVVALYAGKSSPILFTCLQFAVVAAVAGALAMTFEPISLAAIRNAGPEIAYVGVLSSALTFTLLTLALRSTPPSEATIIVSTETLFAAFGAYVFMGERLTSLGWLGAALILGAIVLVQVTGARRSQRAGTGSD